MITLPGDQQVPVERCLSTEVRIFAINLLRSRGRWERLEPQLQALGLPWERFDAIDGAAFCRAGLPPEYDPRANRRSYSRPLSAGEIACYLSHLGAMRHFLRTPATIGLILEDDVVLRPELMAAVATVADDTDSWDMIKLGSISAKPVLAEYVVGQFRLRRYRKIPISAYAYLVTRAGAERLLKQRARFSRPFDVDLQHYWEADLRILGLEPYPVRTREHVTSDLEQCAPRPRHHHPLASMFTRLGLALQSWYQCRRSGPTTNAVSERVW